MSSDTRSADSRPVTRLLEPFARFAALESSSSLVLLLATVVALLLANSRLAGAYEHALELPIGLSVGLHGARGPVAEWVNDGLMAVFFLVVGLEVKREFLTGELRSPKKAALPVLAALGGMVAPALVFLLFNHGGAARRGWGVPIATDIAFSLAILTTFGNRLPSNLRVFLATLAIADDIGGVLVIAVAYTSELHLGWLGVTLLLFIVCLGLNRLGVTRLPVYLLMGAAMWETLYRTGVHPTLSGILLAIAVPSRSFMEPERFLDRAHARLEQFARAYTGGGERDEQRKPLMHLRHGLHLVDPPLDRMETMLHPWVSYGIMPAFALANAGISLRGFQAAEMVKPAFLGIVLGLVIGKPLGITLFSWAAVKGGVARLPEGVRWAHVHAAGWVAGIGFTVAIFVAGLAFGAGQQYTEARTAILLASTAAAALGAMFLWLTPRPGGVAVAAEADEVREEPAVV